MFKREDERGWMHLEWELDGITPKMLDWWFCNMEKGFALWHPKDHKDFYWLKRPKHGDAIGAIQVAPQVWPDGRILNIHIRWEDVENLDEKIKEIIVYDHVLVAAAISLTGENLRDDAQPLSYRIHQWEKTDFGVKGISSAIPVEVEPKEHLYSWAKHGSEEILYFQEFLPELYRLWRKVDDPHINPYFSFKIVRQGKSIIYEERLKKKGGRHDG